MKLIRLIKMCLNETFSKVRIGEQLSHSFPFQNGLTLELLVLARICYIITAFSSLL
jgi:hypothetical protein